jgi:hypothetical protein
MDNFEMEFTFSLVEKKIDSYRIFFKFMYGSLEKTLRARQIVRATQR